MRPGGVVSAILYSGQVIGTDEKQTVLEYLRALPLKSFTVLVCDFANWAEAAPSALHHPEKITKTLALWSVFRIKIGYVCVKIILSSLIVRDATSL